MQKLKGTCLSCKQSKIIVNINKDGVIKSAVCRSCGKPTNTLFIDEITEMDRIVGVDDCLIEIDTTGMKDSNENRDVKKSTSFTNLKDVTEKQKSAKQEADEADQIQLNYLTWMQKHCRNVALLENNGKIFGGISIVPKGCADAYSMANSDMEAVVKTEPKDYENFIYDMKQFPMVFGETFLGAIRDINDPNSTIRLVTTASYDAPHPHGKEYRSFSLIVGLDERPIESYPRKLVYNSEKPITEWKGYEEIQKLLPQKIDEKKIRFLKEWFER